MRLTFENIEVRAIPVRSGSPKITEVTLVCCPNLKNFERTNGGFNQYIIKNIISKYLPTVTSPGYNEVSYIDKFVVRGTSQRHPDDKYNDAIGERIAMGRAKRDAYQIMNSMTKEIMEYYARVMKEMSENHNKFHYYHMTEKQNTEDLVDAAHHSTEIA